MRWGRSIGRSDPRGLGDGPGGCGSGLVPRRKAALDGDEDEVDDDREDDRGEPAEEDLGREAMAAALEDEEAEAAEAVAEDAGDRHEPDRRDRREADARDDERERERDLDLPEPRARGIARAVGRLEHVARHAVEAGRDVADEDQQGVQDERDLGGQVGQPGERDEEREEREARDRVEQAGDADDRAVGPAPPDGQKGEPERDDEADRHGDRREIQVLQRPRSEAAGVGGDPGPVDHGAALASRSEAVGTAAGAVSRMNPAIVSAVTVPSSAPVRSTTSPAWTSASRSIERASLSVVRRSRSGDAETASSASMPPSRGSEDSDTQPIGRFASSRSIA